MPTTILDVTEELLAPNWSRAALLTIDMQNDFASPAGSGFVSGTDEVVQAITTLVHVFREVRQPIFHAVRLYLRDGSNVDRCRRHLVQSGLSLVRPGTHGARPVAAILPATAPDYSSALLDFDHISIGPSEWIFYKPRWSAFYGTNFEVSLKRLGVNTLVVAGCNFPNCPSATLFDASERDFRMVLVADAVSGSSHAGLQWCTGIGAKVCTVSQVKAAMSERK